MRVTEAKQDSVQDKNGEFKTSIEYDVCFEWYHTPTSHFTPSPILTFPTPSPLHPHTPQEDEEDSGEEVDLSKYDLTGDDDEEERKGDNDSKEESKWVE